MVEYRDRHKKIDFDGALTKQFVALFEGTRLAQKAAEQPKKKTLSKESSSLFSSIIYLNPKASVVAAGQGACETILVPVINKPTKAAMI